MVLIPKRSSPLRVTLAVTGASGSAFAARMLTVLDADPRMEQVHLVVSPSALRVLAEESGLQSRRDLLTHLLDGREPAHTTLLEYADIGAPIASGSYPTDAMIVLPCSMGTLAGIAHGLAQNLIERAADVCLKERRQLVLCVRETPFNLIHLRNMTAVSEAGATVFPIMAAFYTKPETLDDLVRHFVDRVLAHIGLSQPQAFHWGE